MRDNRQTPPETALWRIRPFWALLGAQFQLVLNNVLFISFLFYYLFSFRASASASADRSGVLLGTLAELLILFALPFAIAPGFVGVATDTFHKKTLASITSGIELAALLMALAGFTAHSTPLLWSATLLLGLRSALFSPLKTALLAETVPRTDWSWANGVMHAVTATAITVGLYSAPLLLNALNGAYGVACGLLVGLSMAGAISARGARSTPPANPAQPFSLNPAAGASAFLRYVFEDPWLAAAYGGLALFGLASALLIFAAMAPSPAKLPLTPAEAGGILALYFLGCAIGGIKGAYLSGGRVEVGLLPLGALFLGLCALALAAVGFQGALGSLLLIAAGVSASFVHLPMVETIQSRASSLRRGTALALGKLVSVLAMGMGAAVFWFFGYTMAQIPGGAFAIGPRGLATLTALVSAVSLALIAYHLPLFIARAALCVLFNTFYRLRVFGGEHMPSRGGALLVTTNASFMHALLVLAATDRPVRFVVAQEYCELPWTTRLARILNVIPISGAGGPEKIAQSLLGANLALRNGEVVCLFSAGQISRMGQNLSFKKGLSRIIRDVPAPIIPLYTDRLMGVLFNNIKGELKWKWPRPGQRDIEVTFGPPLPPDTPPQEIRRAVQQLGVETWERRSRRLPLLHRSFIRNARMYPWRLALADARAPGLKYGLTLVGAIAMARKLKPLLQNDYMVGLLVPPSVGGALANIALLIMGKVPINLNYTASKESIISSAGQCELKHVLTSRAFLEKLPVHVPAEPIYLEDIKKGIGKKERIQAILIALLPTRLIERLTGSPPKRSIDDLAAIIFSSGSSGDPKGVMLSHRNVAVNIDAAMQVFPHSPHDGMMGILPFFHSFGFTGTLWLPLARGFRAVFHPTPLDPKAVGELIQKYRCRFFVATPTFLQTYIRKCLPEEFESLLYVVTGAEKLSPRIREAFLTKFGIAPLEGYGTTECAPIVSVNVPDFKGHGFVQLGDRPGSIGQPIPGIAVRIIHPETRQPLPDGEAGLLLVKGPNVMRGYLHMEEKTREVLQDGWYDTGDVAKIDEDGFIIITDRLARFSKIAGEMVPHNKIEETLHALLGLTEQRLAITGVPDEKKGERLVALHTLSEEEIETLIGRLDESGLPNLWLPRNGAFYRVDALPVLGTGKLDLQRVKALARELDVG